MPEMPCSNVMNAVLRAQPFSEGRNPKGAGLLEPFAGDPCEGESSLSANVIITLDNNYAQIEQTRRKRSGVMPSGKAP